MTAIKKIQLSETDIFDIHATEADAADQLNSNAGSATKPVYFENGLPTECSFEVKTSVPANAKFTDTDTKNTTGANDTSSKIYLVGATERTDAAQTYSHDTVYVGTDGHLYSNNKKVSVDGHTHNYLPLSGGTLTGGILFDNTGTSQSTAPGLTWEKVGARTPYFGYAKNQTDGTFVWSTNGTEYSTGLAIGGSSGALLWQTNKVMTAIDKLANPNALNIQINNSNDNIIKYDGADVKNINLTPALIGAANATHEHAAGDVTTGVFNIQRIPTIPIDKGGTGAATKTDARTNLEVYSISQVDNLINGIIGEGAAENLDTINKISAALKDNEDILDTLTPSKDFEEHMKITNPHSITKATIGLSRVEDKSSADIRGELQKSDVTDALGYTPPTQDTDTTYTFATGDENGQIKITPSNANAQNISVKGLGTAAYKNVGDFATTDRNEFTGNQILANHKYLYGTYTSGDYVNLIGLSNNDNIIIGSSAHPDTNIYFYGKLNLNHALPITEGGTGGETAAVAINNISAGAIQLGDSGISTLTVNGIDYAMTSAEYDELIALT